MTAPDTDACHQEVDRPSVDEAVACFDRYLAFQQRHLRIPGVQAAVYYDTEVTHSAAYGEADAERQVPLRRDHLFRVASHSKTFTATAVLQLVEQGRLRLDDPVRDWVKPLQDTALDSVTVGELLCHGGGVVRDGQDGDFWQLRHDFPDAADLLAVAAASGAAVLPPNQRFKYSNIGYSLLGLVVEAVTGRAFNDHVVDAVVAPLGLRHTGPEWDPARAQEYAAGYTALSYADRRRPIDHVHTGAMSPATGFYSCASDMVRFYAAHSWRDPRVLTDASKRRMQHRHHETGDGRGYGLGLAMDRVGGRDLIGHSGGYPGHVTHTASDPQARLAVSVLTNALDALPGAMAKALFALVGLAVSRPRPRAAETEDLARFTGRFVGLWGVIDVVQLGGRLYRLRTADLDPTEDAAALEVEDPTTLRIADGSGFGSVGETLRYTFAGSGLVRSVRGESGHTLVPEDQFTLPDRVHTGWF